MIIGDLNYNFDYLTSEKIPFRNWSILAEMCFDTDNLDFINEVINTKILFYTRIEEKEYQKTLLELMLYRSKVVNNKKFIQENKKIHISA